MINEILPTVSRYFSVEGIQEPNFRLLKGNYSWLIRIVFEQLIQGA